MAQPIAIPVLYNTDYRQNELLNPVAHNAPYDAQAAQPNLSGVAGQFCYSSGSLWYHNGSVWLELGVAAGSTVSSVSGGRRLTNTGSATSVVLEHDQGGAATSTNSGSVVIQSLTMSADQTGHVEGISTINLDNIFRKNAIDSVAVANVTTAAGASTTSINISGSQNITFESRTPPGTTGYPAGIGVRTDTATRKVILFHANTSTLSGEQASGGQFVQGFEVDDYGHITNVSFGTVSTADTHLGNTNLTQTQAARLYDIASNGTLSFRGLDNETTRRSMMLFDDANDQIIIGEGTSSGPPHLHTVNLVVNGNLTVRGEVLQKNSSEVNIGDNIIRLNAGETGAPTLNAGIEVERGTSPNVTIIWNETQDYWETPGQPFAPGSIPSSTSYTGVLIRNSDNVIRSIEPEELVDDLVTRGLMREFSLATPVSTTSSPISVTQNSGIQISSGNAMLITHGTAASGYAVNLNFAVRTASTTQEGVVETATNIEAFTGYTNASTPSSGAIALNPANLRHVLSNVNKFFTITGNGTNKYFTLTHGMNTRRVKISVCEGDGINDYVEVLTAVVRDTDNTCKVLFADPPSNGKTYFVFVSNFRFSETGTVAGSATY